MSIVLETKYFYLFQLVRFLCYCVVFFVTLSDANPFHKCSQIVCVGRACLFPIISPTPVYKREQRGTTNVSSPLLCICVYFCCHPNAKLETVDVGVLLRQSDQG